MRQRFKMAVAPDAPEAAIHLQEACVAPCRTLSP